MQQNKKQQQKNKILQSLAKYTLCQFKMCEIYNFELSYFSEKIVTRENQN